jgi:hypothetical protein
MSEEVQLPLAANGGSNVVSLRRSAKYTEKKAKTPDGSEANTEVKPPPLRSVKAGKHDALMSTQRLEQAQNPLLSYTSIRGVAAFDDPAESPGFGASSAPADALATSPMLRSDKSVMLEVEAFRRDPMWRVEKIGRETADVTTRGLSRLGEALEDGFLFVMTKSISGTRFLAQQIVFLSKEAWRASKAIADGQKVGRREGPFEHCEMRSLPQGGSLRVNTDESAPVALELAPSSQVHVYPSYPAPKGWVLARKPDGEIGFLLKTQLG